MLGPPGTHIPWEQEKKKEKTNVILWWVIIGLMALPFGQCLINKVVSTLILLMKYCQKVIAFSHFYWWNFLFFSEKSYQISSWDEMTVSTTSWKLIIGSYSDHRICHPDTLMERCPRWEKVWWGRTFPIWNVAFPSISRNISFDLVDFFSGFRGHLLYLILIVAVKYWSLFFQFHNVTSSEKKNWTN